MPIPIVARRLLAKSRRAGREISLRDHLLDTATAARLIFDSKYRVGRNFCRAFKLSESEAEVFMLNLVVACLFHDLGKANSGFANAIEGKMHSQVVRHEHLSALVLQLPEIQDWLSSNPDIRQPVVLAAVLGHHLKAKLGEIGAVPIGCTLKICDLFFDDAQVRAIVCDIAEAAGLCTAPVLSSHKFFSKDLESWRTYINQLESDGKRFGLDLLDDDSLQVQFDRRLLAAVKAALIVADSVASGVVREGASISSWLKENLHVERITKEELFEKIIDPCTDKIADRRQKPYKPADFQQEAAALGPKSLLRAGCGAGKTLAAYYWAAEQLDKGEFGRVIFLYPTRGTATEGFKGYTGWAPANEALLLHGSSKYVLESMMENPPESARDKHYLNEMNDRLYSLSNFKRRFFSATVDQFLSFLQFNYSSLCMSVILTDSVVVVDEAHSFDKRLFETLLEYLKSMNIPTLIMTATLPANRVRALANLGLEFFPSSECRDRLEELKQAEDRMRYQAQWILRVEDAMQTCLDAVTSGERVLWVVNTVDQCQRIAEALRKSQCGKVICYHSRYRVMDREKWHQECIEELRPDAISATGVVAVTTQVCEMSLDLDADRLITELAPIPSLIQRMGRANRHQRPTNFLAPIHFYQAESVHPYLPKELEDAQKMVDWLTKTWKSGINQSILSEGMAKFSSVEQEMEPSAKLFDSGYFTSPAELRDIDEFTVPAILDGDLAEAEKLVKTGKAIDPLVVPVPRFQLGVKVGQEQQKPSWLPRYLNVASSLLYEQDSGFRTHSKEGV